MRRVAEPLYTATRTVAALELLALSPRTTTELAQQLRVHPRTARRLLRQLAADEWVARGADRRYRLTMRLVAVTGPALTTLDQYEPARSAVRELAQSFSGRFDCWVPSYGHVLSIADAGSDHVPAGRLSDRLVPRHCTAAGKALLATRDRWRASALAEPLERHTDETIVDPAALARACEQIAASGIAIEAEEFEVGRWALAVPVIDAAGVGIAALSATTWCGSLAPGEEIEYALREQATLSFADVCDARA